MRLDQYLAVAYFQQGVSNFLVGDFEEALANFNDTLLYLRGNNFINYDQLGLQFKLYSCEVLFNRGLCYIYLQQKDAGMQDLSFAVKEKAVEDHNVIDEAIREEAEVWSLDGMLVLTLTSPQGYTVFSIPVGVVFRPNAAKVKNLKTKDYLGKARLVAASDSTNAFTDFSGAKIKNVWIRIESSNDGHADPFQDGRMEAKDDRLPENLSFAATNLVKPGLSSKRQQSEPPLQRIMFPPTPPPESERTTSGASSLAGSVVSRGASLRNGTKPMLAKLNIDAARPKDRYEIRDEQVLVEPRRLGPQRAASESRGPSTRRDMPPSIRRRQSQEEGEDGYAGELYDMYRNTRGARSNGGRPRNQPQFIEEEEEYVSDYDEGSFDENEFEMVSNRAPPSRSRAPSQGASSRRPEIQKVRVKVHAAEESRYIMIGTAIEWPDFQDRIRDKFALRKRFKIKVRDDDMPDGDMITMGDQDDLEMAMVTVKSVARKERLDMGKMEVSSSLPQVLLRIY